MFYTALIAASLAFAPPPVLAEPAPAQPAVESVTTAALAVSLAAADIVEVDEKYCPSKLYVWIPPHAEQDWAQVVNFAVNTAVSRSDVILHPSSLAGGQLLRYDLALLAPRPADLVRLLALRESLATDEPYFHVTSTQIIPATKTAAARSVRVAAFAPHLPAADIATLAARTRSSVPIVRADWFVLKILTTLNGGRYYDFVGFERQPNGTTAKAAALASLGINEQLSAQLGGDQRAAMFRSEVTGKPRLVSVFRGVAGRSGSGLATITYDTADEDVQAQQHPILNLLSFKATASEFIAERPNGLHVFALFDNKGNLQNSVPDNIASDSTIPAPHSRRLEPAISCIRCHGPGEGLQPFKNDVTALLRQRGSINLDVFDDVAGRKLSSVEVLDRLAGLYAGEDHLQTTLSRGRSDYARAIWQATEGLEPKQVAESLSTLVAGYRYDKVTAERALAELGWRTKGNALETLGQVLPAGENDFEDPRLGALKAGLAINRLDWELVFADAARRAKLSTEN